MFASKLILAVSALAGFASAQYLDGAIFSGQNYSVSGPIAIVPDSLDINNRSTICTTQKQQCPSICGGLASNNTCDPVTLIYNCTCSNGNKPNISDYQQSLPALVCNQWFVDCNAAHVGDATGQAACKSLVCGNRTITAPGTASMSVSPSVTPSAGSSAANNTAGAGSAGTATTSSVSTTSSHAAATALVFAQQYGTPLIAGGMVALFGFAM